MNGATPEYPGKSLIFPPHAQNYEDLMIPRQAERHTLVLDVQNMGSVFWRINFWYLCNLRGYRQSQMLHYKIGSTLVLCGT